MLGYFLAMEKMNKPAWFELADNDQPANVSPKARKGGIFAVVTTLALTGVAGWGFISSEEFPAAVASASSAVIEKVSGNSTSASNSANPITAPTGYEDEDDDDDFRPTQSVTVASAAPNTSSASSINPPSTSAGSSSGNNPILPPSGNSDDDDDDEDDDHKGDRKESKKDHDDDDDEEDEDDD